jgi:hypothetical protein
MVGKEQLIWGLFILKIEKDLTKILQMTKIKILSKKTLI